MKKILIALFFITFLFLPSDGQTFRCKTNNIITSGDTTKEVIEKCGEPEKKEWSNETINSQIRYVEKWFYNCGEGDFQYELIIINSKIFKENPFKRGNGENKCR